MPAPVPPLTFTYTVQNSDKDTDGVAIAANSLSLNGGAIRDSAGNNAALAHTALSNDLIHKVDGRPQDDLLGQDLRITHVPNGGCMDLKYGWTNNGQDIRTWPCNGTDAQKWKLESGSHSFSGMYRLVNKRNTYSHCLDNTGTVSDGTNMHLWGCLGRSHEHASNQYFSIEHISGNKYRMYFLNANATTKTYVKASGLLSTHPQRETIHLKQPRLRMDY